MVKNAFWVRRIWWLYHDSFFFIDSGASNPYLTERLEYRFQKPEEKFTFRAGSMLAVVVADKEYGLELILWVWPGLSFGRTF